MIDISNIFNNMETTFAVNAVIELFGSLLVFIVIIMAINMRFEKNLFRLMLLAGLFTIIAASGDAVAAIFRGRQGKVARWAVVLGNFFGVGGSMMCAVFYANVLFYMYKDVYIKTYKVFIWIILILAITMLLMLIVSQFTGWLYTIDDDNGYKRGPLFFVSVIYTILCILCAIIYMIVRRKQSNKKKQISLNAIFYIAIPTVGILLQLLFYGFVFLQLSIFILMLSIIFRMQKLSADYMVEQAETLSKKEMELSQAREQLVLSQVKPHFIYNTLSAIKNIEGNPTKTKQTIDDFATYLRGNLSALDETNFITFDKEIEHVKTYVSLEKLRFGDRVKVEFDLKDLNFVVPPLTIQIFVENAIKHGITQKYDGGTVKISTKEEDGFHVITVKDDGAGFDASVLENSKRIGVRSAKNRLRQFVSGEVEITSEKDKGTNVIIKIPTDFTPPPEKL